MTTAIMRSEAAAPIRAGQSIAAEIGRVFAVVLEALDRQRTRRDLACLDERMLRDIGLSRYEVEMELRRSWWRN